MVKKWTATGVLSLGVALASGVFAQNAPARYLQLVEINVKAGSEAQFETYVKKIREAADKIGTPQGWTFAQPVVGASNPTYYVFVQHEKWAERDAWAPIPQMLTKAFGEAEAQKIAKAGGESIWGSQSTVYTLDKERSWNLSAYKGPTPYFMILRGMVKPDMVDEYQRVISRLKEAQEKAATKVAGIRRTSTYGPSWEFYLAVPMEKFADLDGQDGPWQNAAKAFGEEESRALQATLRKCYEKRTQIIVAIREDLSRTPPAATSN
jgi:hypothetical protein